MDYAGYFINPHEGKAQNEWVIFEEMSIPGLLYAPNQMIYWQGEDAIRFYYLKSGLVRIFISSENGVEKTLTILRPGSLFGEASFFDGLPRVSSAKTLEKSEIIAVNRSDLIHIFEKRPAIAMDLLKYLAKTVRMLSVQVDSMTFLQADRRIAQLLVSLAGEEYWVASTHEEIAALVGVSRITVSKILNRFQQNGWLETRYRSIRLTALPELERFAFETDRAAMQEKQEQT